MRDEDGRLAAFPHGAIERLDPLLAIGMRPVPLDDPSRAGERLLEKCLPVPRARIEETRKDQDGGGQACLESAVAARGAEIASKGMSRIG